jgi:uncharacterized membrane protein YeiB
MALGGILLANLMSFFGTDMLTGEARRALPWSAASDRVLFAIDWFVEGKFYSIFSMLLGVGFALQAARARLDEMSEHPLVSGGPHRQRAHGSEKLWKVLGFRLTELKQPVE